MLPFIRGGANTFSDALDTVAHEIKHLDPQNIRLWNSGRTRLMQLAQQQAINAGAMTVNSWNLCRECR